MQNQNSAPFTLEDEIVLNKQFRQHLDQNIQDLRKLPPSRERSIAITKLQEAVMWLGMDLKRIGDLQGVNTNPYPHSKDPSNTIIDKTADGLKL